MELGIPDTYIADLVLWFLESLQLWRVCDHSEGFPSILFEILLVENLSRKNKQTLESLVDKSDKYEINCVNWRARQQDKSNNIIHSHWPTFFIVNFLNNPEEWDVSPPSKWIWFLWTWNFGMSGLKCLAWNLNWQPCDNGWAHTGFFALFSVVTLTSCSVGGWSDGHRWKPYIGTTREGVVFF